MLIEQSMDQSTTEPSPSSLSERRNWRAHIQLEYTKPTQIAHGALRTQLSEMRFIGPLRVQRPFYPEGETCHTYLLHPPGGMVSGDELEIDLKVDSKAHALLTTPSAGKVYRSDSEDIPQQQTLRLSVSGGTLEWLPQENILFNGSHALLDTEIRLSEGASLIAWDMIALGRQAGDLPYESGKFSTSMKIFIDDRPVFIEGFSSDRSLSVLTSTAGLQGYTHFGNSVFLAREHTLAVIEKVRELLPSFESSSGDTDNQIVSAVTLKNKDQGLVVVRCFSQSAERMRNLFIAVWQLVREDVVGKPPCVPRIWNT